MAELTLQILVHYETMNFIIFVLSFFREEHYLGSGETPGLSQAAGRPPTSKKNMYYSMFIFSILFRFLNYQPASHQPATSQPPHHHHHTLLPPPACLLPATGRGSCFLRSLSAKIRRRISQNGPGKNTERIVPFF